MRGLIKRADKFVVLAGDGHVRQLNKLERSLLWIRGRNIPAWHAGNTGIHDRFSTGKTILIAAESVIHPRVYLD